MMKRCLVASLIAFFGGAAAEAATCSAYPYTLTNGTSADANQVMADFNNILNCANNNVAPASNPRFTGSIGVNTSSPLANLDVYNGTIKTGYLELGAGGSYQGFNAYFGTTWTYRSTDYAYIIRHSGSHLDFSTMPSGSAGTTGTPILALSMGAANVSIAGTPTSYNFFVNGSAAGTGAWINTSDARLKTNVEEISGALRIVLRLRGVRFDWRPADGRSVGKSLNLPIRNRQIGFIAQEVEKVLPEAVVKPDGRNDLYGLKEENIIPILVEAVKEQQAQIDKLRADLVALKH